MRSVVACVGFLAMACAGGAATAADVPPYQPYQARPALYAPYYSWTGLYLGVNGGGGWGTSQWDGIDKFDLSGGLIGGTVGYNWQVNQLVVGAEGDIDWSGIKGTTTFLCGGGCETRNQWLATVRGRLGYAWDRFLPYLTAGLAAGDINTTRPGLPAGSGTNAGWTVGAGLDRSRHLRLRPQLRLGAEWQRVTRRQYLSRRTQCEVLIRRACGDDLAPDSSSGAFHFHAVGTDVAAA
jgi:outer membrane immunogenic protein